MKMKYKLHYVVHVLVGFLWLMSTTVNVFAQKLGDNMGNHKATKNLKMQGFDINTVQVVNSENVVIGSAGIVSNTSVALQVNGANKAILVPRVSNLLNASTPIPLSNVVEGMIVYDLTTHKFYVRDNTAWITYAAANLPENQIFIGDAAGNQQAKILSGDVTINNIGVTAIGAAKIQSAMLADKSVTAGKIAPGIAGQYLKTNAAGTAVALVSAEYLDVVNKQANIRGLKTFTSDSGLVAEGSISTGAIPPTTTGVRMLWYPRKSTFRAGNITSLGASSSGDNSAAFGDGSYASYDYTFAAGNSYAQATRATGLGKALANGGFSFSVGNGRVIGHYATGFGNARANGIYSVAAGICTVNGNYAIGVGGGSIVADAANSVALGYTGSTNGKTGSFIFSSTYLSTFKNTENNQWFTLFQNGYQFYTNSGLSAGATLLPDATSWTSLSDKRKKENFQPADHSVFLSKIDTMVLGSWNYKVQDPRLYRHYGPMAQDFHAAFGQDRFGKIGNDTTISSTDIDGVNMIGVQALIKLTDHLKLQLDSITKENELLALKLSANRKANADLLASLKAKLKSDKEAATVRMAKIEKANRVMLVEMAEITQIDKNMIDKKPINSLQYGN